MLWSCDDDLFGVAVADLKHPGASALANDRSGFAMEPVMGHALLDAWVADDVDFFADLKLLDDRCHRWNPAAPQLLLELVTCLFPWSVMVCHILFLLFFFDQHDIEAGNTGGDSQSL